MPKNTLSGPSYADENHWPVNDAGQVSIEQQVLDQEEGEQPSPGSSSQASSEKDETSPQTSDDGGPSPAPTTGSRSPKGRAASSSAGSTDGGGRKTR